MSLKKISIILCTSAVVLTACGAKEEPAETKTNQISSEAKKAIEESKKRGQIKAEKRNSQENQTSEVSTEPPTTEAPAVSTEEVTTELPTTALPTTEIPVTSTPTTEEPTTETLSTEEASSESLSTENPVSSVTTADQLQQIMFGNYTEVEKRQAYNAAVASGVIPPGHMDGGTTMQAYQSSINVQQGLE
ncbi:hypothetical protein ERX27_08690 [Macrococcus brunensis]|uniref:Uncharacterized protein n=1 Tax=Macrococcus brunensis TaxID=198483 RepID=A0A4R6BBX8_9STAP|nr:hypothetical protein [Macrococcus brunensis]TDL95351.1 hypothetical protein ERX27_08690 [Macrococcus brunensis]